MGYRKIPKSPGTYIFQRPFLRGIYSEGLIYGGKFAFQSIGLACNLTVGSKLTVFALFYLIFDGKFPSTNPRGAYIWRSDLTEGFLRYWIGGLIFGGACTWRGLVTEFYGFRQMLAISDFKHRQRSGRRRRFEPREI